MSGLQRKILIFALVVVLGLAAGTSLFASQCLLAGDAFPRGTFVGGRDVSELTKDEATRLIAPQTGTFANSEYRFIAHDFTYSVKARDLGADLDVTKFLDQVMEQERKRGLWEQIHNHERRDYPLRVPIEYDQERYDQIMAEISGLLERPVKICRVKWDAGGNPILVPGQDGVRIDREATYKSLPLFSKGEKTITANLEADFESVNVSPGDIQNQVVLGSFTTYFSVANINRSSNLRIAASALNGAVVPPGQEFSFNVAVGPREFSTGYKEAMIILQNEFKPGVGGGICQVSSTLYNAILLANLPVVERHNHSVAVAYAQPGTDATVAYQAKDLRFRNDTGGPICIKTVIQGGKLTIQVLGKRHGPVVKVKIEREVFEVTDFKEIRKGDPELLLGQERVDHEGVKGYRVRTYRVVYDDQGQLFKRDRLSSDVYKPLDKLIFVGTKVEGPIDPAPEPPPDMIPDPTDPNTQPELPEIPDGDGQGESQLPDSAPGVTDHNGG